jgi:hypothetical protein
MGLEREGLGMGQLALTLRCGTTTNETDNDFA